MKESWARLRRWTGNTAKNRGFLLGVGTVTLIAALVTVNPSSWWRWATAFGSGMVRFWLPVVLFLVAGAAFGTAAVRWWGGPWRVRRRSGWASVAVRYPLFVHVTMLLVVGIALTAGVGLILWWLLGRPDTDLLTAVPSSSGTDSARPAWGVQNTLDAMKVVLSIVAGVGGVIALTVAYRKQDLGEAAEHREDTKLFTERFGKAADQLGSDQAAVRLAGVYAMARLADDWEQERQTCIDVLCAYLRMPYTPPEQIKADPGEDSDTDGRSSEVTARVLAARQERQVRHTVVRIIAAHLREDAETNWQGRAFDFTGSVFDGGDFNCIVCGPNTKLAFHGAEFSGGTVDFGRATFSSGTVAFGRAEFSSGTVDLSHPRSWQVPPQFDPWSGPPPLGLRLPQEKPPPEPVPPQAH
ncbi:MAG: hypothetical protein HKP61_01950 [Dactylosporangium sp.]|nr:hypothetical protein [Dactylosporangium sp.]NNJ59724.1 hypothetical protein [Dactylosporangium sp.]